MGNWVERKEEGRRWPKGVREGGRREPTEENEGKYC